MLIINKYLCPLPKNDMNLVYPPKIQTDIFKYHSVTYKFTFISYLLGKTKFNHKVSLVNNGNFHSWWIFLDVAYGHV